MRFKTVALLCVVFAAMLCLSSSVLFAGDCKQVNAKLEGGPILFDPDCDGWDICQEAYLMGTPNGSWWVYLNLDGGYIEWEDGTIINVTESVLQTAHGDIYSVDRAIVAPGAPEGFAQHSTITGGTGRYEGVTGWIVTYFEWVEDYNGRLVGEICWPED